jgi:hypothetical protein
MGLQMAERKAVMRETAKDYQKAGAIESGWRITV